MKKFTKVKKIINGYAVLEDNWISKNDKTLYNRIGKPFLVLDFKEITDYVPILTENQYLNKLVKMKFSCIKLESKVNIGDVFSI